MEGSFFLEAEILAGNQKIPASLCRAIAKFAISRFREEEKKCFLPTSLLRVFFTNGEKVPTLLTAQKLFDEVPPPPKKILFVLYSAAAYGGASERKANLQNTKEAKAEGLPAAVAIKRYF